MSFRVFDQRSFQEMQMQERSFRDHFDVTNTNLWKSSKNLIYKTSIPAKKCRLQVCTFFSSKILQYNLSVPSCKFSEHVNCTSVRDKIFLKSYWRQNLCPLKAPFNGIQLRGMWLHHAVLRIVLSKNCILHRNAQ